MPFAKRRRITMRECGLLSEAVIVLAIAALSLKILHFRRVVTFTSRPLLRPEPGESERARVIAGVRWSVQACARRVHWRAKCFEQGIAAGWMLRRRGIAATLHYGVAKQAGRDMFAHVWVRAAGQDITGCETATLFTEIARFPAQV